MIPNAAWSIGFERVKLNEQDAGPDLRVEGQQSGLALAQIRRRNGTIDPVFYRQCATEIICTDGCAFLACADFERTQWGTFHRDARLNWECCGGACCVVRVDAKAAGRAARDRFTGPGFWRTHTLFARYDLH